MGVADDGTLNGISLLSISETAGLGMRAGEVLVPQFAGKQVEQFSYTKTGAASDDQIDAISGATITTNAVVNGVNAGLLCFQKKLNMTEGGAATGGHNIRKKRTGHGTYHNGGVSLEQRIYFPAP